MSVDGPRVLVAAPMRSELRPVVRAMSGRRQNLGGVEAFTGRSGRAMITASMIGVGPDAARRSTERLLAAGRFDHVVVSGIAGGIGGIAVGSLVTPAAVEDLVTGRRYEPETIGGHRADGVIGTTAELILDEAPVAELVARGLVGLDMETSAVAEVCSAHGLPWSAFRVVSDRPEDGLLDSGVFAMLETDGTVNLSRAARYLLRNPRRLGALFRLSRDSAAAAGLAARSAVAACATL